jgi:hypothetical protein
MTAPSSFTVTRAERSASSMPASAVRPSDKPGDAHRRAYPEQYTHPLVGTSVSVVIKGSVKAQGTVLRVVQSRFGPLAKLDDATETFWSVKDCKPESQR